VLLPARAGERSVKMVSMGESKLWPLDDAEEQLKTHHLITNSKLHELEPSISMLRLPKTSLILSRFLL